MLAKSFYYTGWRPFISWAYAAICLYDLMFAQIILDWYTAFWSLPHVDWQPKTLSNGAVFHISMGGYIAATSYGRTKEKLAAWTKTLGIGIEPELEIEPEPDPTPKMRGKRNVNS